MSSLANTKWTLTLPQDMGTVTFTFNANGTASAGGPNTWFWTEAPDGSWMIQTLNAQMQNNVSQVYFGQHADGMGTGYFTNGWNGSMAILGQFTMHRD